MFQGQFHLEMLAAILSLLAVSTTSLSAEQAVSEMDKKISELQVAQRFEEALELSKKNLEIKMANNPAPSLENAWAQEQVAGLSMLTQRDQQAAKYYEKAIDTLDRIGNPRPELRNEWLTYLENMRRSLAQKESSMDPAAFFSSENFRGIFKAKEKKDRVENDPQDVGVDRMNRLLMEGYDYEMVRDYSRAEKRYKEALAIFEDKDNINVQYYLSVIYGQFTHLYMAQHAYGLAEKYAKEVLRYFEVEYDACVQNGWPGCENNIVEPLAQLARVHVKQGRPELAEPLFRRAYESVQKIDQESSKDRANNLRYELASVLVDLKRGDEAYALYEQWLLYNESRWGARSNQMRLALQIVAPQYRRIGKSADAKVLEERASKIPMEAA